MSQKEPSLLTHKALLHNLKWKQTHLLRTGGRFFRLDGTMERAIWEDKRTVPLSQNMARCRRLVSRNAPSFCVMSQKEPSLLTQTHVSRTVPHDALQTHCGFAGSNLCSWQVLRAVEDASTYHIQNSEIFESKTSMRLNETTCLTQDYGQRMEA